MGGGVYALLSPPYLHPSPSSTQRGLGKSWISIHTASPPPLQEDPEGG